MRPESWLNLERRAMAALPHDEAEPTPVSGRVLALAVALAVALTVIVAVVVA